MFINLQIGPQLSRFTPITLDEMEKVRLMNRIDTKFITNSTNWLHLLPCFEKDYLVQEVMGSRIASFHTIYYDTPHYAMYVAHHNVKKSREKIRIREYADTRQTFLEIKDKSNKGRTDKKRVLLPETRQVICPADNDFLSRHTLFGTDELRPCLENYFERVTLVNRDKTERLTIDTNIRFRNLHTGREQSLPDLVIIELKQDGNCPSLARQLLADHHIHPGGFSKFCIGSVLTDPALKQNRFKPILIQINKTLNYELFS